MVDKAKMKKVMRQFTPKRTAIAKVGSQPLELPNYSGAAHHSRERSEDYTVKDLTINGDLNTTHTAGSVIFSDGTKLTEDNFNLFWNDATNELQPNLIKIVSDGSQASPALKFNDTNTGFFKSGDSIRLSINNATIMTVDSTGVEVIGTDAAVNAGIRLVNGVIPRLQLMPFTEDNVAVSFDAYLNDALAWKSSDAGSNFQIYKLSNRLQLRYDKSVAVGSNITWNVGLALDEDGNVGINTPNPLFPLDVEATTGNLNVRFRSTSGGVTNIQDSKIRGFNNLYSFREGGAVKWTFGIDSTYLDDFSIVDGATLRFLIEDTTGNVGIGTATPQEKLSVEGIINVPKASGNGIKVDTTTPTFGWRDLKGKITNSKGSTKPSEATYRDGITAFQFSAGDDAGLEFHIPHDYVPGTDIHLHVHWSHISGDVTGGSIVLTYEITYAKGHNQAAFPASVTGTITGTASTTQYQHIISEGKISATTPEEGVQIDSDDLEPDGLILCRIEMTTNNMIASNGVPDPFIHEVDVHYQSTNIATKQRAPDFYT